MSKTKNFFMAIAAVLGMGGAPAANASTNTVSQAKNVSVPVKKKIKDLKAVTYPTSVAQLIEMATDALNKKQYGTCIDLCNRVLITGNQKHYAMACYMLGRAYVGQKNYDKAINNFELAIRYYETYGVSCPDKNVDYKRMFQDELVSAQSAKKEISEFGISKGHFPKNK